MIDVRIHLFSQGMTRKIIVSNFKCMFSEFARKLAAIACVNLDSDYIQTSYGGMQPFTLKLLFKCVKIIMP